MGFLNRLFGRSSASKSRSPARPIATQCDHCGGALHPGGMPAYQCSSCGQNVCNPCALRKGARHSTATVACPACNVDVKAGRFW